MANPPLRYRFISQFVRSLGHMILMILAAVLGAALGMALRPALLAIAAAVGVAGSVQGLAVLVVKLAGDPARRLDLANSIRFWVDTDLSALWPVLAAAGIGSLASAVLWSMMNRQSTDQYWFARRQKALRRFKAMEIVEDRDIHSVAEARFRDIMSR